MRCSEENFVDFVLGCLQWSAEDRINPFEAMQHGWILEGLPDNLKKKFTQEFEPPISYTTIKKSNSISKSLLPSIDKVL